MGADGAVRGEGPIDSITANADGSGSMSVMGIDINIPAGLTADTPTAQITIEQLADPTPLPAARSRASSAEPARLQATAKAAW